MRYFWIAFLSIVTLAVSVETFAWSGWIGAHNGQCAYGNSVAEVCSQFGQGTTWWAGSEVCNAGASSRHTTCPDGQHWQSFSCSNTGGGGCYASPSCANENETYNPVTGQCEGPPCPYPENPVNGSCGECPSLAWNATTGECLPETCSGDEKMPVYEAADCVSTGGSNCGAGQFSQCINTNVGNCQDSAGTVTFGDTESGSSYTFEYCNDDKSLCEAEGGTYGAVGVGDELDPVCLVDYGDQLPTCVSGSQYYIENQHIGGTGFSCISADPPADVCDGSRFDCDGDGNVDDQDGDGVTDNGTSNINSDGNTQDVILGNETNVGDDPLDPAVEGAGDCDPTSTNYQECTGQVEEIQEGTTAGILDGIGTTGDTTADGIETSATDAMGTGDAGIGGPTGLANDINGLFNVQACSDLSYPFYGHNLTISCAKLQVLRTVLSWVVSIVTLIAVFQIATRKVTE